MRLARGHLGTRPLPGALPASLLDGEYRSRPPDSRRAWVRQAGSILPERAPPFPAAMGAAGPAAGLAALVAPAEVYTHASVDEVRGWAEFDGDLGDPRSLRGALPRALGAPHLSGTWPSSRPRFGRGPPGVRAPALSADVAECPFQPRAARQGAVSARRRDRLLSRARRPPRPRQALRSGPCGCRLGQIV